LNGLKSGKDKSSPWVYRALCLGLKPDLSGFPPRTEPPTDIPPHEIRRFRETGSRLNRFRDRTLRTCRKQAYSSGPNNGHCCEL